MRASMVVPTVRGVGVSSEWMVTAVDSALSSVRWRAAILIRLATIALALKARMYSAWEAAKHLRTAVRRVWRAPWCVPDAMVWWKETVDRDDGVVTSPVPVMVDESASPWVFVWMMAMGVVAGVAWLSLLEWG